MQHATRYIIASIVLGVVLAAVADYFEEIGRWDSLRFMAVAFPAALVPWTAFIWYRTKYVPRNDTSR